MSVLVLSTADWIWIAALAMLVVGGLFFMDRLLRRGVYDEETSGTSSLGSAISNLQTIFDPAHRHVLEERDSERAEDRDSGEPPEAGEV